MITKYKVSPKRNDESFSAGLPQLQGVTLPGQIMLRLAVPLTLLLLAAMTSLVIFAGARTQTLKSSAGSLHLLRGRGIALRAPVTGTVAQTFRRAGLIQAGEPIVSISDAISGEAVAMRAPRPGIIAVRNLDYVQGAPVHAGEVVVPFDTLTGAKDGAFVTVTLAGSTNMFRRLGDSLVLTVANRGGRLDTVTARVVRHLQPEEEHPGAASLLLSVQWSDVRRLIGSRPEVAMADLPIEVSAVIGRESVFDQMMAGWLGDVRHRFRAITPGG